MRKYVLLIALIILLAACSANDTRPARTTQVDTVPVINDESPEYPTITTTVSPTNPTRGNVVKLTISGESSKGIRDVSWESTQSFSNGPADAYPCNNQIQCSYTWELITLEEGLHEVNAWVVDSNGLSSGKVPLKIEVGPYRESRTTETKTPEAVTPEETVEETPVNDNSCSSHSDCGYKERCIGSVCQSVDCTSDSHCSGCRKCSSNRCVACGSGPYGCYC